jgi:hypothetical protein
MVSDINAPEQFPSQIARGHGAEEIGDHQSNCARDPENHGLHFGAPNFTQTSFIADLL